MIIRTACDAQKKIDSAPREKPLAYGWVPRDRWNVLDLLDLFGMQAISTYVFYDVDMQWVLNKKEELASSGIRVTPTAFLLKAIALAQRSHPASRTYLLPGLRMVTYNEIVAGFTVEREVNGNPVVFFGEIEDPVGKSLAELSARLKEYVEMDIKDVDKLKEQAIFTKFPWLLRQVILYIGMWFPRFRLTCMKATFGLSSLGALGVNCVYGPSVCTSVFGVGTIDDKVVVDKGEIAVKPIMNLVLCFDQRVMDGGQAAQFVLEVKKLLEGGLEEYVD